MKNSNGFQSMERTRPILRASRVVSAMVVSIVALLVVSLFIKSAPADAASNASWLQSGSAQLTFTPASSSVIVGSSTVVTVSLDSVTNLYGYQFQVNYDSSKVNAVGAFINDLVDTSSDTFVPGSWNASCAGGICSFAVTKKNPTAPITGSGPLARITFTGVNVGTVPLSFNADILADRDGNRIIHTTSSGTLDVYGTAIVSGTITLQGRATPITSGTVTLTDDASKFTPTIATFDASTGVFSATVPVDLSGSTYNLDAAHSLYLTNHLPGVALAAGDTYTVTTTRLKAGDANNNGKIDIFDLSCIGGGYETSGTTCGATGSSDINADGTVNIFDLVLVGGNYELSSPQPW